MAKYKDRKSENVNKWEGPEKPDEEKKEKYNKDLLLAFRVCNYKRQEGENINDFLNNKIKAVNKAFIESAESNIEQRKKIDRNLEMSEDLKAMFETRQRLKEEGNFSRCKIMTQRIRRAIRKERLENNIRHLEEELWYDIKKAKRGFVPNHTKLAKESKVIRSVERPEVLADYFENIQWAIDNEREQRVNSYRFFSECADIDV